MKKTRVLIFEDNDALRTGISDLLFLSKELEIIGAFSNCMHAEHLVKTLEPDVILMDIDMPGRSGIEALRGIRSFNKNCNIIMLTIFDDNVNVFNAIRAGASGYLLKKNIPDKLHNAISEVLEGGAPMSAIIAKMVINSMQNKPANEYNFKKRELEILQLLCEGNSYKMIAVETGLTFETIRSYIKGIYQKLEVHSATEAVSKVINDRLI